MKTGLSHLFLALCLLISFPTSFAHANVLEEDSDPISAPVGFRPSGSRDSFVGIFSNADYTPLIDLIGYAKKSIDIEIYMMNDAAFREALRGALARGVVIRVLKDPNPIGETCKFFDGSTTSVDVENASDCNDQKNLMSEIQRTGSFQPFDRATLCGQSPGSTDRCFQHGKLVIVDVNAPTRRLALLSTGNFNNSSLCELQDNPATCNRDYTYITRDDEVIHGLNTIFNNDLKSKRYDDGDNSLTHKITVSPYSKRPLIEHIRAAKHHIQLQNQYMKDPDWNQALMDAAKRGVKVELMMTSDCSFGPVPDGKKTNLEARYREFEKAGVALRFFTAEMAIKGKRGYLHAKAMVIDNQEAWVGSVNGSTTSLDKNREFGIFFDHPQRVRYLANIMAKDQADADGETWQEAFQCKKDRPDSLPKSHWGSGRK